jgi:hypothetical protein
MRRLATPPVHVGHGWLALVVPADATRFRVADAELADTLRRAGAELVEERPDVEVAPIAEIRGDAPCAVVAITEERPEGGLRLHRAVLRISRSLRMRIRAAWAALGLRRRGFTVVSTLFWMLEEPLPLPELGPQPRSFLPLRALVVGRRSSGVTRTLLDAARTGSGAGPTQSLLVQQGILIGLDEVGVLRVSIGPAGRMPERQRAILANLRSLNPPPSVAERVPWPLGSGRSGPARWTLERRLPGIRPAQLTDALWDECVDFLVALHRLGSGQGEHDLEERAEVIATTCRLEDRAGLSELARRLSSRLAGIPLGFAHGDFWSGNLLVERGRLTGVVDWDYAGEGRLPLMDLFHLWVNEYRVPLRLGLGRAVLVQLLPSVRSGGDRVIRAYCAETGLDQRGELLTDLALAYWLDWVAHQLEIYSDRQARPVWIQDNVQVVLREVASA